ADSARADECVARDDLLDDVQRSPLCLKRGRRDFACEPRLVVVEESAVLDYLLRDWVESARELRERNLLAAPDSLYEAEVGRGQKPDVLAVLPVDFLNRLRDDEFESRGLLRERRGLARRAAPLRQTRHDDREPAVLNLILLHRALAHADVDVLAQRLVVVE